jgi:magnesium-transporting ATPase (P-type)
MFSARFAVLPSFHPRVLHGNQWAIYSTLIVAVLQLVLTYTPGLNSVVFGMWAMNARGWGWVVFFSVIIFLVMEIEKLIRRELSMRGIKDEDDRDYPDTPIKEESVVVESSTSDSVRRRQPHQMI